MYCIAAALNNFVLIDLMELIHQAFYSTSPLYRSGENVQLPCCAIREESLGGNCPVIKSLPKTIKLLSSLFSLKCTASNSPLL